jgi:hypothetical protein
VSTRVTTMLLDIALAEAIDTARIPRVAGRTGRRTACVTTRPRRAPILTSSDGGLISRRPYAEAG